MAQLELEREAANAINDEEQEIEEFNDTGKITNKPKSAKTSEVSGEDEIDTKKDGEKYDDMGFIPFGKEWDAKKVKIVYFLIFFLSHTYIIENTDFGASYQKVKRE